MQVPTATRLLADLSFIPTQVFTGRVPFDPGPPAAAMMAILEGKRPPRPTHQNFTDGLWALMEVCWNQHPYWRPEMSVVLQTLRGSSVSISSRRPGTHLPGWCSDPSSDGTPSNDLASAHVNSQTPPGSTDPEMEGYFEYPKLPPSGKTQESGSSIGTSSPTSRGDSTGRDETGSTLPSGISQVAACNPTQNENNPPYSDKQGGQSSRHISQSQSRRGTLQSEPQTPLPIDPAQVSPSQVHGHPGSKSHTNLPTTPGKVDASSLPRVDGNDSRESLVP